MKLFHRLSVIVFLGAIFILTVSITTIWWAWEKDIKSNFNTKINMEYTRYLSDSKTDLKKGIDLISILANEKLNEIAKNNVRKIKLFIDDIKKEQLQSPINAVKIQKVIKKFSNNGVIINNFVIADKAGEIIFSLKKDEPEELDFIARYNSGEIQKLPIETICEKHVELKDYDDKSNLFYMAEINTTQKNLKCLNDIYKKVNDNFGKDIFAFWVLDKHGIVYGHPFFLKNHKNNKDKEIEVKINEINSEIIKASHKNLSGFVSFKDGKDIKYGAVAYYKYLDGIPLIIASGVMERGFPRTFIQKIYNIKKLEKRKLLKLHLILWMLSIGIIIFLLILRYRLAKTQDEFREFFKTAQLLETEIDVDKIHFEEFRELAKLANEMIKKMKIANNSLRERDNIFKGMEKGISSLFRAKDEESINDFLRHLAEGMNLSAIAVFKNYNKEKLELEHLWDKTNSDFKETFKEMPKDIYKDIIKKCSQGKISFTDCAYFKDKMGFPSALLFPITVNDMLWGILGIFDKNADRIWSDAINATLVTIVNSLGFYLIRLQHEKKLKEDEKYFTLLSNNLKAAIYLITTDGIYSYVNNAMTRLTGYSKKELYKMKFYDLVDDDYKKLVKNRGEERLQKKTPPPSYKFLIVKKSGEKRWMEISNGYIELEDKTYILGTALDITDSVTITSRIEAEKNKLESIITNINDALITLDNNWKIKWFNPIAEKIFKTSNEDVQGKLFSDIAVFKDAKTGEKTNIRKMFDSGVNSFNNMVIANGNQSQHFIVKLSEILGDKKQIMGFVVVLTDISEQIKIHLRDKVIFEITHLIFSTKNLVEFTHKVREYLSKLIDTKNFYFLLYDSKEENIEIVFFQDEYDDFTDKKIKFRKKSFSAYLINARKPLLLKQKDMDKLLEEGKVNLIGTKSKVWMGVPLIIKNDVIGVLAVQSYDDENLYTEQDLELLSIVAENISIAVDRMRKDKILMESEKKYHSLYENAYDSILILDNEKFIDCNMKTEEVFGYKKEEIIGKTPFDVSPEFQNNKMSSQLLALKKINMAINGSPQLFEWKHKKKDGTIIDCEVSLNTFEMGDKKLILAIVRDVSERKQMLENLKKNLEIQEFQTKEIYHRVMNNLQTLRSIFHLLIKDENYPSEVIKILNFLEKRIYLLSILLSDIYAHQMVKNLDLGFMLSKIVSYWIGEETIKKKKIHVNLDKISAHANINVVVGLLVVLYDILHLLSKNLIDESDNPRIDISLERKNEKNLAIVIYQNGDFIADSFEKVKFSSEQETLIKIYLNQAKAKIFLTRENDKNKVEIVFKDDKE